MKEIATREHFRLWAKMGYAARGAVYLVIGLLALLSALNMGGSTTDSKGAIVSLRELPLGNVLLALLAIGLCGYALWRLMQGIGDADSHGKSPKALLIRASLVASGVAHSALALWVARLLLDAPSQSGQSTGWLSSSIAPWLIGGLGVAAIAVGIAHLYKGWTARFERYMAIPAAQQHWIRPLCRFGLIARGFVWCILGWILINSALLAGRDEVQNISDALLWLRQIPFGDWLLGLAAVGLMAFGIYSVVEASYRRINTQPG